MIIPSENRATMKAYRNGRSIDRFLDDMWERREREIPRAAQSIGSWPFVRAEHQDNVTSIKQRRKP